MVNKPDLITEPEFWVSFFLKSASPCFFLLVLILVCLLLLLESALKCHALRSYKEQLID